ncbi:hypothetical protein [Deinococcus frigens]|uniref:hypothetical protein n=1 Tax=Deinococcus frigens TaxID=249403 RepID=UPI00049570F5|nr:hypothetical protein [Deinococcus frigens]
MITFQDRQWAEQAAAARMFARHPVHLALARQGVFWRSAEHQKPGRATLTYASGPDTRTPRPFTVSLDVLDTPSAEDAPVLDVRVAVAVAASYGLARRIRTMEAALVRLLRAAFPVDQVRVCYLRVTPSGRCELPVQSRGVWRTLPGVDASMPGRER